MAFDMLMLAPALDVAVALTVAHLHLPAHTLRDFQHALEVFLRGDLWAGGREDQKVPAGSNRQPRALPCPLPGSADVG